MMFSNEKLPLSSSTLSLIFFKPIPSLLLVTSYPTPLSSMFISISSLTTRMDTVQLVAFACLITFCVASCIILYIFNFSLVVKMLQSILSSILQLKLTLCNSFLPSIKEFIKFLNSDFSNFSSIFKSCEIFLISFSTFNILSI